MKTNVVIKHFDGVCNLAKALGCTRTAIYQWGDVVPQARQYQIQILTSGALVADTPNKETVA